MEILASLPGVGRIVLATLLAEAFDALQRRDYAALRSLAGVAPVTKRSGKSCLGGNRDFQQVRRQCQLTTGRFTSTVAMGAQRRPFRSNVHAPSLRRASRTPGPPPFSGMNSIPAASSESTRA
ncbi:transposase [Nitratireductor luteus]|uniref:transposase n=1 Tax=Nitratireductor luteus TaxID=2976980 RepID=UPI00223F8313